MSSRKLIDTEFDSTIAILGAIEYANKCVSTVFIESDYPLTPRLNHTGYQTSGAVSSLIPQRES